MAAGRSGAPSKRREIQYPGSIVNSQTINLDGIFDWDGAGNNSQFFVNPGKTFNLTATSANIGNNIYSGQLSLLAGTINVDVAADLWTMAGTLRMTGAIGQGAGIVGDPVDVTGAVETDFGEAHFFATTSRFLAGSTTNVNAGTSCSSMHRLPGTAACIRARG